MQYFNRKCLKRYNFFLFKTKFVEVTKQYIFYKKNLNSRLMENKLMKKYLSNNNNKDKENIIICVRHLLLLTRFSLYKPGY